MRLYNLTGGLVQAFHVSDSEFQLTGISLASGIYLLEVLSGEQVWREKVVVAP